MLLRKPFVNRRRKKKSGLAVDRAEMAHQCSAQAPENQFHNDSLRHAQTIKSDRLLAATAAAFIITSTGFAAAQRSPLPPAPAEKIAPQSRELNSLAPPGVTEPGVTEGKGGIFEETIPPEDRARYREVFTKARDARVDHVDFDLSVGVKIPSSIPIAPIPAEIVEIEPQVYSFDYFVSGDKVVIVDPQSLEIAAIFTV